MCGPLLLLGDRDPPPSHDLVPVWLFRSVCVNSRPRPSNGRCRALGHSSLESMPQLLMSRSHDRGVCILKACTRQQCCPCFIPAFSPRIASRPNIPLSNKTRIEQSSLPRAQRQRKGRLTLALLEDPPHFLLGAYSGSCDSRTFNSMDEGVRQRSISCANSVMPSSSVLLISFTNYPQAPQDLLGTHGHLRSPSRPCRMPVGWAGFTQLGKEHLERTCILMHT